MRLLGKLVKYCLGLLLFLLLLSALLSTEEGNRLLSILFSILALIVLIFLALKLLRSGASFPSFSRTYFQGRAIHVREGSYQGNWFQRYREYQSLQVTAQDEEGERVTALMVGSTITGQIVEGDEIRIYGNPGRDGIVRTSRILNLSQSHWVNARKYLYCFVATVATGNPDGMEVRTLKRFRDEILMKTWPGFIMVEIYYAVSPSLALLIGKSERLKRFCARFVVRPAVWAARRFLEKAGVGGALGE